MNRMMFSVLDRASGVFGAPVVVPATAVMFRMIQDEYRRGDNMLKNHPKDFGVYLIGEFDDESGVASGFDKPTLVFEVASFVEEKAGG